MYWEQTSIPSYKTERECSVLTMHSCHRVANTWTSSCTTERKNWAAPQSSSSEPIDVMQKRGWLHTKTPHFQFRPVALHSWLTEAKPMTLITKVSVATRVTIGSLHHHE